MAQEMLVLNGTKDGTAEVFSVMFRFVIATPIVVNGTNVVPTPTTQLGDDQVTLIPTLPKEALDHDLIPQATKDAFDAGTQAWEVVSITRNEGDTIQEVLDRLQATYASRKSDFDTTYQLRWNRTGTTIDEV